MALPVEEMQRPEINSFTDELGGNALESSLGDHPRVKQAVTQVFASGISGSVRLLIRGTSMNSFFNLFILFPHVPAALLFHESELETCTLKIVKWVMIKSIYFGIFLQIVTRDHS
ncbi:uncharacterized protein LOC116194261 isoform X1 [Punica granatum]|uniref:Uncharacterized protein LOC116194261 isoform X1 n=1 Tax=Punica granatum TaxID=22663 RepID=A0A6P8CCX2_PUNGR|nr:uncharacterized protein LOC116194261 isoform X1 [Punica granatum]